MDFCLYDPDQGYYTTKQKIFGSEGDYYTTPHVHPLLAYCLAEAVAHYFELLSRPPRFQLVELGAGQGVLARDLLQRLQERHPRVFERIQYVPLEIQDSELPHHVHGVVFSNEFFDALPVHRVRVRGSQVEEIYLEINDQISEVDGEVSDPRILEYMRTGFGKWNDGCEYEANLRMVEVLKNLDSCLESGIILTIDYGYDLGEYNRLDRPEGTLMCYHHHQAVSDPYINLGQQDITAHVNFEVLARTGEQFGWENQALTTQRQFLLDWGLEDQLSMEESHGLFSPDRIEERLRLKDLLAPGGISDTMKVMAQRVRLE